MQRQDDLTEKADPNLVAEILEDAAGVIESTSLVKGFFQKSNWRGRTMGYCALGAIEKATNDQWSPARKEALKVLYTHISRKHDISRYECMCGGAPYSICIEDSIIRWSDTPERTASEVIDAMNHAAKDLRNRS